MKKYVNGEYIEMAQEEIDAMKAEQLEYEKQNFYAEINAPLTDEKKLELFIASIPVLDKPQDMPRSRTGYLWKPMYDAEHNCFGWEEIEDPYYVPSQTGSYIDPIRYIDGMEVEQGLWYTDGDNLWECVKSGVADGFNSEWFDIIG